MKIRSRKSFPAIRNVLAVGVFLIPVACGNAQSAESSPATALSAATAAAAPEVTAHAHGAADAKGAAHASGAVDTDGKSNAMKRPQLGGLSLGMSRSEAEAAIGIPATDSYTLPEAGQSVAISEYGGLTVGFDASGKVAYVEISTADIATGIPDIEVGSSSADAARDLNLKDDPSSASLTAEIDGGILRLDLDRELGKVVAVKLIGQALV